MSDSYSGIISAFNSLRLQNGSTPKEYSSNYQGIIDAILDLKREWGGAQPGEYPPGWGTTDDGSGNISGDFIYPPKNGQLWFDERQGRLMVYVDDGFYQANGADVLTRVSETPPGDEVEGALWYQPSTNSLYLYDGTAWVIVSTASASFALDDMVLDANARTHVAAISYPNISAFSANQNSDYNVKELFKWIATSLYALDVDIEALQEAPDIAVGATAPTNPIEGDLWYDSTYNCLKVRVGTAWVDSVSLTSTEADITALQALVNSNHAADQTRMSTIEASVAALPFSNYATTTALSTAETTLQGNIDTLTTTVGDLTRFSTVADRTTLLGGLDNRITTLENATIDFSPYATVTALNTAITNLQNTITASNYASVSYVDTSIAAISIPDVTTKLDTTVHDAYVVTANNTFFPKAGGELQGPLSFNRPDVSLPSIDFSGSNIDSMGAFKLKAYSNVGSHTTTFGTTPNYWEYAWEFSSNEDFCWKHGSNGKIMSVNKDGVYCDNLVIGDFQQNTTNGVSVVNQVNVGTKLASHDASITTLTSNVNDLMTNADNTNLNQIYYGDVSPTSTSVNNGDLWFDSANLRLNVRHGGFWVFPDRVEDVALKSALYSAVNNSTDYATLKSGLLTALT